MIPLHTLDEQGPVEASAFENGLLLPTARVMPVLDITGRHGRKPHIMMARPAHDKSNFAVPAAQMKLLLHNELFMLLYSTAYVIKIRRSLLQRMSMLW